MSRPAGPMSRAEAAGLLSVAEDADGPDVQRAFLRAARHVHPDTLPDAGEDERRRAEADFDRLLRARDVLLVPAAPAATPLAGPDDHGIVRGDPDGPRYRRVEGRGIGGSLVVLALLAFLLVLLVTFQQGVRGDAFSPSPDTPSLGTAP